jgi:hypothetical protein
MFWYVWYGTEHFFFGLLLAGVLMCEFEVTQYSPATFLGRELGGAWILHLVSLIYELSWTKRQAGNYSGPN